MRGILLWNCGRNASGPRVPNRLRHTLQLAPKALSNGLPYQSFNAASRLRKRLQVWHEFGGHRGGWGHLNAPMRHDLPRISAAISRQNGIRGRTRHEWRKTCLQRRAPRPAKESAIQMNGALRP